MVADINNIVFPPDIKLADLVESDFNLLNVLSRLGISPGFGDDTVSDVCDRYGIDQSTFLLICCIYAYEDYVPSAEQMVCTDPLMIVDYLHRSHSFYLEKEFVSMERDIKAMVEHCDSIQKKMVAKFFSDYKAQVENHFAYEEDVVFPYVRALVGGESREGYTIEQFEENHSNIDETLCDLKNIVMKYLPDTCDTVLRNEVLYRIFRLERDLSRHTALEEKVLIPVVNRMEEDEERL